MQRSRGRHGVVQTRVCAQPHACGVGRVAGWVALGTLVLSLMAGCTLRIDPTQSHPPDVGTGSTLTIHVKVVTGPDGSTLVLLPVMIGGSGPYDFALDTGASTSLIASPIARRLHLKVVGPPQPVSGVASQTQATPIRVEHWSVETLVLPASTVLSADLNGAQHVSGLQGLVGSDVWRRFGSVTIDYSAQTLTVAHRFTLAGGSDLGRTVRAAPAAADRPRALAA